MYFECFLHFSERLNQRLKLRILRGLPIKKDEIKVTKEFKQNFCDIYFISELGVNR